MVVRFIAGCLVISGFFLGPAAHACNVKQSAPGELTLTVGSSGCGANATQVANMAKNIKSAIAAMPAASSSSTQDRGSVSVQRSSNGEKLYKIADMNDQARFLSGLPKGSGYYAYPSASTRR